MIIYTFVLYVSDHILLPCLIEITSNPSRDCGGAEIKLKMHTRDPIPLNAATQVSSRQKQRCELKCGSTKNEFKKVST